jgi:hypothetical protein
MYAQAAAIPNLLQHGEAVSRRRLEAEQQELDDIRAQYMRQHQQESVLRVDDPFLVWVSF